ncbi:MAG TPA: hypothetical protein VKK06_18580 [Terriglobia bacterium]|nr:hypothetical protein [Terriglobia bacterium]
MLKAFTSLAMFLLWYTAADSVDIQTAHGGPRELQAQAELQAILTKYDLRKYLFTRRVIFDREATNHAFPVLTLNVRFAGSEDELLSSFLHEQLHWWLRNHPNEMERALRQLRRLYPRVPVGLPDGADTEYSTYGHLVDCYLEIHVDRQLIGETRTLEVIKRKPWYTWIYRTILQDESKIAAIVAAEHLNAD